MKYFRNAGKPKKVKSALETESISDGPPTKKARVEFKQFPQIQSEPVIPTGEDDSSYLRNHKMLLLEEKKLNPNKKIVSVLMARTFAFRRQEIMKSSKAVPEILKMYTCIHH